MRHGVPFLIAATCGLGALAGAAFPQQPPPAASNQTPDVQPTPLPQDRLDFKARSSVVQGSGARAYGMGGAFLARPDDATAASWNPAGLSYLRTPELSIVGAWSKLDENTRNADGQLILEDRRSGGAPDFAAGTYPISLGSVTGAVQLSFQRVISFDADRTIEQASSISKISSSGGFDVIALGSGLQLTRSLRAGFAVNRWFNGWDQRLSRSATQRPTIQTTDFGFSGWNVNLGAIWSPVEPVNLGAVYKSGFTARIGLSRERLDLVNPVTTNAYSSGDVSIDFPAAFGVGASWRPTSPLTVSADYTLTQWSKGRIDNYFTLPPTGEPAPPDHVFPVLTYPNLGAPQSDTEQIRVGAEYVVLKTRIKWPLRAGYFIDRQLFRVLNDETPTLHGFTVGTGLIFGRMLIDVAYVYQSGSYLEAAEILDPELPPPDPNHSKLRSQRFFVSLIYRHRKN
ncbi:MAG: OmpP1/FadL family transporter [Vicinamibacteria bacterium]